MTETIFIVTNTIFGGEYVPSVFYSLQAAQEWLKCATICNFIGALDETLKFVSKSTGKSIIIDPANRDCTSGNVYTDIHNAGMVDEFYEFLNEYDDMNITAKHMMSYIEYADESYN